MAAMSKLTKSMCWDLVMIGKDKLDGVSAAIYRKPTSNECYEKRPQNEPPLCKESDDPNAAWYFLFSPWFAYWFHQWTLVQILAVISGHLSNNWAIRSIVCCK
jgi:hypothetical protein